jgi:hypothetical protein
MGERSVTDVLLQSRRLVVHSEAYIYRLHNELKEFYSGCGVLDKCELSLRSLTAKKVDQLPVLSGAGIKAATVKALVPFVAELARKLDDGTYRKHSRHSMMDGLVQFYEVLLA